MAHTPLIDLILPFAEAEYVVPGGLPLPSDIRAPMIQSRLDFRRLWSILTFVVLPFVAVAQIDFTANITEGCNPLIVSYTVSAPGATSYSWNLGNNTLSSLQSPSVTYTVGGQFTVSLTVSFADGTTQTLTKPNYIEVFSPPTSNFSALPLAICAGNSVTFSNLSQPGSGAIVGYVWDFGDGTTSSLQSPSYNYPLAGTYTPTLIVTDVNGCSDVEQKVGYLEVKNTPSAAFVANNTLSCNTPFPVTFTTVSPVLGTAHSWNFGNGNLAITANPSTVYNNVGNYTVTHIVSDPAGCADTVTIPNLIQVGSPTINFQVSKNNACVGELLTFSCGAAPGSIVTWNFGNGTTSNLCQTALSYAAPGTYTVTINLTDPSGCTYTASQVVTIHPNPVAAFTVSDTLLCEEPHVVTFTATNSPGATYQWNFGDGTTGTGINPTHTYPTLPINSPTGQPYFWDVTLVVTNQFGCTASFGESPAVVTGQTVASFNAFNRKGCAPRQVSFFDGSLSPSTVTSWQWDFGDGSAGSTLENPVHTYQDTGYFDVTLIIETEHGCRDTLVFIDYIAAGDTPVADFIPDTTRACASTAIEFFNLSINSDSSSWIFGDGGSSSLFEPTHQFADTGYFSVMLIALDRGCPDTLIVDSLVYIDPPIALFLPNSAFGCELPFTVDFEDFSIGADTWQWDFGDGSPISPVQDPTHIYTAEGAYQTLLIVENLTTGCSDTLGGLVMVELVDADFSIDTTFGCSPVQVVLTDQSYKAVNWLWDLGDGTTSAAPNPGHLYTAPGKYDVTLNVANSIGCTDDTSFVQLVSVYEPQVSFVAAPSQGCAPLTVTFTNNTTSLAPVTAWSWTFGPPGATSTLENPTYVFNTPGSWSVGLAATDSLGCANSFIDAGSVFLSQPIPNFSTQFPINCPNNAITFLNASTGSGLSYLWDFGDNTTSAAFNPTHSYTQPGTYTVSLTVTDFQGCDSTLVIPNYITIADPVISILADSTSADCPPLLVNFTGNVLSPHPFVTWNWDFGNGVSSVGQNPSHIYVNPGTYTVSVTATSDAGCVATATVVDLIQLTGPSATFTVAPTAVCPGVPVTFTASSPDVVLFTWDFNNGSLGSGQTTTYAYPTPGVYLPLLIIEDTAGCVVVVPNTTPVTIYPVPQVSFSPGPTVVCDSGLVNFTNTTTSTAPITGLSWNIGLGLSTSTLNATSFFFDQVGSYDASLIAVNSFGCADTLVKTGIVNVVPSPTAAFGLSDTTGCAPFSVTFNDLSTPGSSPITQRLWNFNLAAPSFSAQLQPSFLYLAPGVYNASLQVTDQNGCSASDTLSLEALAPPVANFAADDSFGCAPKAVQFQSLTPNLVAWEWRFGDNTPPVNEENPLHTYLQDGTYTVTLYVEDTQGCRDTLIKPQYIRLDHPQAQFEVSDTVVCPGDPIQFTDLSVTDTSFSNWFWQFGNGMGATQQNPSFAYPASGLYDVSLRVRDVFGCEDSLTKPLLIRVKVDETPIAPMIHYVTVINESAIRIEYAPYNNFRDDFREYRLYRQAAAGNWQPIFVSSNLRDTAFTDQGLSTITSSYCYRLEVINHCDRPSDQREDRIHCSILLQSQSLVDAIELTWSPYVGWPVDSYYVYRVQNYTTDLRLMTTLPGNVLTWVDEDMFCYDAHFYRITAKPVAGVWSSRSNIRREAPMHFGPPFPLDMQLVTVEDDSVLMVQWGDVPPGDNLVEVFIEKDAGMGYQFWYRQSLTDTTRQRRDSEVNVQVRPYAYRAFVLDSCGDVTPAGYIGQSIWLQAKRNEGSVILNWTPYDQWENGVDRYTIELFDELQMQFITLATVQGNQLEYVDRSTDLAQGTYCYRIRAFERGGNVLESVSNESCITVDPLLYFPNAFSPNQDAHNDVFLIKGAFVADFEMAIFNRWGELIYLTTDQSAGWDGRVNGVDSPEGVYVFKVIAKGYEGEEIRRSGTVTLFR